MNHHPMQDRIPRHPHPSAAGVARLPGLLLALGLAFALLLAPTVFAQDSDLVDPVCPVPIDPQPTGTFDEPGDSFGLERDYQWAHSGTFLQGRLGNEKWAWAFHEPIDGSPAPLFQGFRSVVVVNNPDPVSPITVQIAYRDLNGTILQTNTRRIQPEGFVNEIASPLSLGNGLGSVQVVANEDQQFVGAVLHHSYRFDGVLDVEPLTPAGIARNPGLASMQQLQDARNGAQLIYAGPFPTTSTAAATHVFLRGNLPTFQLINPNDAPNTVDITLFGSLTGTVVGPLTVTLAPFGSYIDLNLLNGLYDAATNTYLAGIHDDWLVQVNSVSGLPVLGEQLMLDFYDDALEPFTRFRMTSAMMATQPALLLYNPELTYTTSGPPVHTISAIGNVSAQDIGPVVIEYRDLRNGLVATDTIASFPSGATQRIAPGEPNIVNYPVPVWDGNVRIRACGAGLIGWTAREVEPDPSGTLQQFRKAYGEALDGANLNEPGDGFQVTTQNQVLTRKVSPLARCALAGDFPPWWPSYTTFANLSVANVGQYYYQFFQRNGTPATVLGPQPFLGVPFGFNSFTFEDGVVNRLCDPGLTFGRNVSGRVDHENPPIKGIDVIGDPLVEWEIEIPTATYAGPGDTVPTDPQPADGGDVTPID